jgi:hypothetical protein
MNNQEKPLWLCLGDALYGKGITVQQSIEATVEFLTRTANWANFHVDVILTPFTEQEKTEYERANQQYLPIQ